MPHGGALLDPTVRQAFLVSAYASIVEATDTAVQALIQVAEHGRNELARVAAAKEILDRAGITILNPAHPNSPLALSLSPDSDNTASVLLERLSATLDSMGKGLTHRGGDGKDVSTPAP